MRQKEYFGVGCVKILSEILLRSGFKKIFLVTGKNSFKISGAENFLKEILSDYRVIRFDNFTANPKLEEIENGIEEYKKSECDIIISVGGGSVVDVAKSINILAAQEKLPDAIIRGEEKINKKGKTLIAIPTTSGAGSEATHFAVVYIGMDKFSIAHKNILPDISIIDPQLTFNLDKKITATSGIDALCQSVESYWSVNSNTESKKYSEESIKIILENLEYAVNEPAEINRVNMSRAANLSGKSINIAKTTAPHAISYSMTSCFGITHGQAVSISLGEFLEYNYGVTEKDSVGSRSAVKNKNSIEQLIKLFRCQSVEEAKLKINKLIQSIGLKTQLSELNIKTENDLKIILDNVNYERLQNNPRAVSRENLAKILRNIL
ncbi:MAG: phosphonoacetaldehyde reductase [Bacteroidota bacterium]|nr:phosphonoacetaldehyde reductase [Bacteroidota bacterium]